jgi:hypothetical protein
VGGAGRVQRRFSGWAELDNQFTAQEMMVKVLDQIYALSPLAGTTTTTPS